MTGFMRSAAFITAVLLTGSYALTAARQGPAATVDADDFGGTVASAKGPEAGVWVIAETADLPTKFVKIVVTDDRGRYLMPDLPAKATYNVWVRGYGLVDSAKVQATPGRTLNLTATVAPTPGEVDSILKQVRLDVTMSADDVTAKLEAAKLFAATVERVTRHHESTWGELAAAPAKLPEGDALIGLFVRRGIPADSYALIENEQPQDYWYVMPITIVLGIFGLLFTWALARAVRDLLPVRVR